MSVHRSRATTVIAAAAILALGAGTGAVAGSLITSQQIENNTIRSIDVKNNNLRSKDVKDGTLKMRDLAPGVRKLIRQKAQPGKDGAPGSVAGVQTNWAAKDGATIVDANTVRLSNPGTPAGASVEILDLNLPVQATKTVRFTYRLADGAVYAAGSPRVFFQIGETYYNTFDADPADAGVANGDGTFTKTAVIPANGTVHAAGVVVDSGVGTVTVTNLVVSGYAIKFKA